MRNVFVMATFLVQEEKEVSRTVRVKDALIQGRRGESKSKGKGRFLI